MAKEDDGGGKKFVPPDGGYGWIIVLATTFANISLLPLVQCFGIIFATEFKEMEITAAETSFLLHLHSAIYCSLGLLASPLLKKYDFRRVALFGAVLMITGILLTSFAKSYTILICTVSILIGVGQGIFLPATYVATNTYFKKRLTLAVAFSVTGASLSAAFMPQVCTKLLKDFGRQTTVLVLAAISLAAIICCFLMRPIKEARLEKREERRTPEQRNCEEKGEIEPLHQNGGVYHETTLPALEKKRSLFSKISDTFDLELLKDRTLVVVIVGMSTSFASELNTNVMISFVLPELASFETQDVATFLCVMSIADIVGRLAVPLAGHWFSMAPRAMYGGSLVTSTAGRTLIAIFFRSWPTVFFCAVLLGLAKGTKAVYQSVIIPKFVPLDKFPAANGLNMLLTGVLSLVVGPAIGWIHDLVDSYVYALHAGSILSMSCVALWAVHYVFWERDEVLKEHARDVTAKCEEGEELRAKA